jgi:hypothetical protein
MRVLIDGGHGQAGTPILLTLQTPRLRRRINQVPCFPVGADRRGRLSYSLSKHHGSGRRIGVLTCPLISASSASLRRIGVLTCPLISASSASLRRIGVLTCPLISASSASLRRIGVLTCPYYPAPTTHPTLDQSNTELAPRPSRDSPQYTVQRAADGLSHAQYGRSSLAANADRAVQERG